MSGTHIDDDFYTDMLNGLVSRDDAEHALNHATQCESCEETLRRHLSAFETLRAAGRPVKARDGRWILEAADDHVSALEIQRRQIGSPRRSAWRWISPGRLVAGGLVAAAIAIAVMIPRGPKLPPPEYWLTGSREVLEMRSGGQAIDKRFWEGVEAYESKRFELAIHLLRQAGLEGPYNDLRMIYIASTLTLMQDYPRAVDVVRMIEIDALPEPSRSEVKWIKYIALTGDLKGKEAKELLEELVTLDNDVGKLARERKRALD